MKMFIIMLKYIKFLGFLEPQCFFWDKNLYLTFSSSPSLYSGLAVRQKLFLNSIKSSDRHNRTKNAIQ